VKNSKILITASTGNVGSPLSKALYKKQIPFTAATRDPEKAMEKFEFETDTVYLDFKDPSGFENALKGKEILFLCGPSATPGAEKLIEPLVEKAIYQDVKHIVFIASYPGIMKMIEKTSLKYTFIKANFFMQNFEMYQTEDIRDRNQMFMPTGKGKAPFIHTRDIGEVAAEVIENPEKFENELIYITGPESLDHFEAAHIFSDVLGRNIIYMNPDDDTYRIVMKERGFSEKYIEAMIAVFGKIRKGQVTQTSDMVEKILGRKAITFREYVEEMREYFS